MALLLSLDRAINLLHALLMQGFLTTDGHEIYTDGFDMIDRMRARGLMMSDWAITARNS